jgi:tRNA threonylcarbamoyl adenosine modification protein YeaZ
VLILLLDTSLKGPLLALADASSGRLLDVEIRQNPQEAAADLPRLVQSLLTRQGKSWDQIEGVIVGTGPGSFTGIKIGLSFVYGLHRARPQLGLYGSSALGCFARVALEANTWMLPATATHGYFATRNETGVVNLELERISLEVAGQEPRSLTASGSLRIGCLGDWPRLNDLGKRTGILIHPSPIESRAYEMLNAMLQDFIANSRKLSDVLPMPQYLRKSAPEEKAEKKV